MAPKQQDTTVELLSQGDFQSLLQEQVRMAVRLTLVTILEEEVSALIGALPYQRTPERRDYRNGHYTRDLETTVGLIEDLAVPRTRNGHQTQVFDKYKRRRTELDDAISEMLIGGGSTLGQVRIERVTPSRFSAAWELRKRFQDKPTISFTDLTSMAIMDERDIRQVLTQDGHFIQVGMGFSIVPQAEQ